MKKIKLKFWLSLVALAFFISSNGESQQMLQGHMPTAITNLGLQPTGRLDSTIHLNLAIGLPLQNQAALTSLLQQLYDPASPYYHHWITPEQFTAQFGPTEDDYQALITFAKKNGLTVTTTHPNRVILDVNGTVSNIEKIFHVNMHVYQHPKEARTFYAPDAEPSLDLAVPILHISGLDNYALPHPCSKIMPPNTQPKSGSGPGGFYRGSDFRTAYVPGTSLTGTGQSVGLLQFDDYNASDITTYESQAGLPNVPLTIVPIDGGVSHYGFNFDEVNVDIEMVISMAPGISRIYVYEAPNPSPFVDLLNRMATDNLSKQLSCSWIFGAVNPQAEAIFLQMQSQGQSFFQASGDANAYLGPIPFPAESPNITIVGGTTLTTGSNGQWSSETVWMDGNIGSSGGVSSDYLIPSWQQNINMNTCNGSMTYRNIPDVALTADNILVILEGQSVGTGGTSCATPLWAGFTALVNQQLAANSQNPIGFINPAIYEIGKGSAYASDFHDITTGSNNGYSAVGGYDLCTGWGTPKGQLLINALAPTIWSGTVNMNQNFTVNSGTTLKILSGTNISFASGTSLIVNGTLNAEGTSSQPITFTSTGGAWGGILFQANSQGCSLNYCNISHATYGVYAVNSGGLYTFHVEPTIQNCTITNNSYGIYYDNCGIISSNPIQYNTISNNSAHGIYLNTSWPQSITGNIISGNGGDGISMNNCNGNIIGNTISNNWGNGIYCYNHSAPQIRNNVFRLNGWGVHCDYYSPANLGSSFTDYGHNVFHESNASIMATGLSNVIAGDYAGYGLNSFYSDQLVMNHLWIDNSIVEADYDYWEGMGFPDAYIINGGRLDYTTVLNYDPNAGMGKIVASNSPATNSSSKITGLKSGACDTSAFLDADLRRCLDAMLNGKYEEAIHQYSRIYKKEKDPVKKQYILTQIATCYSRANKNNFVKFLNSDVLPNLSKDDRLYATTLELENFFLIQDGKYDPAIANFDTLTSRFTRDTATVKHALFGLWSLYFHDLKNAEKAKGYLDELKAKFPKDDLTRHAKLLVGEVDSVIFNNRTIPKDKKEEVTASAMPEKYALQANYPNPFNPTTNISYQLPATSQVSIKVYDMLGREIATLVNGMKEPGYYSVTFDGSRLSSGIYFTRMIVQSQEGLPIIQVKKMLLMK